MTAFRLFLISFWLLLAAYTAAVIATHGWNLLPVFFGDMGQFSWPGQFNLDFFGFLLLSGLWVAWRHHFTAAGLALGLVGSLGGIGFLAPYLLFHSVTTKGNIKALLLGPTRAAT